MPCDGKNPNCDRRRELLAQLKCLVSSMDRKKPCEWDEPDCPPPTCCPVTSPDDPCCRPLKCCKSFDFRSSLMHRCECIKRNGLQDRCMMWDCMGRPECMTKLYPVCGPGRSALLKLTDLGDVEVALRKFYCADQAREAALAAYCRLACNNTCPSYPADPPYPSGLQTLQSPPSSPPPYPSYIPSSPASLKPSPPCNQCMPCPPPCTPYMICPSPRSPSPPPCTMCSPPGPPPPQPRSHSPPAYPPPCPQCMPCCLSACA